MSAQIYFILNYYLPKPFQFYTIMFLKLAKYTNTIVPTVTSRTAYKGFAFYKKSVPQILEVYVGIYMFYK